MDHPLIDLINARIEAAERDGAFEGLKGAGKPLPGDGAGDPMARLMRQNGAVPEWVGLRREIAALREKLADTADRTARARLIRDLAVLETRAEIARRG